MTKETKQCCNICPCTHIPFGGMCVCKCHTQEKSSIKNPKCDHKFCKTEEYCFYKADPNYKEKSDEGWEIGFRNVLADAMTAIIESIKDKGDVGVIIKKRDVVLDAVKSLLASQKEQWKAELIRKLPSEQEKPNRNCINAENRLFGSCLNCVKIGGYNQAIAECKKVIKEL